jgi:putative transposase
MPNYRRDYSGHCWFFTVVTHRRRALLTGDAARAALHASIAECRVRYPFAVDAWVLLPDHLHCIWTLPDADRDYSRRWSFIKRRFTQRLREASGGHGPPHWQDRFWAHRIDDETDYARHVDYIHINPVKHEFVRSAAEWPWSTLHRYVREGVLPDDWGGAVDLPAHVGRE